MSKTRAHDDEFEAAQPDDQGAGGTAGAEGGLGAESSDAAVAEMKDKWLRALAELENVRRASRIESEQVRRFGATPLLQALLGVLDNLQRALTAPPAGIDADYLTGLQHIERQFIDTLAASGVTVVPAQKGQRFDPSVHRALMEQESDEVEPGAILTPVLPGYRLHDRLLREAQVVVARGRDGGN